MSLRSLRSCIFETVHLVLCKAEDKQQSPSRLQVQSLFCVKPSTLEATVIPLFSSSLFRSENQVSSIGSSGIVTVRVLHTKVRVLEYLPVFLITDRISSN